MEKEHNYCYKHDDNTCKQCDPKIHGSQCGYYCHRCPCPNCLDNFMSPFVEDA
jgi:hypothetical protein